MNWPRRAHLAVKCLQALAAKAEGGGGVIVVDLACGKAGQLPASAVGSVLRPSESIEQNIYLRPWLQICPWGAFGAFALAKGSA